jgi:hypothetical protein
MEIRSYRKVFDLERRVYRVDHVRLNPGGVPVRGVVYFLAVAASALAAARVPVLGAALAPVPWFVRDLALPAASASLLTALRIDGRPFHLAASSLVRFACVRKRVDMLGTRRSLDGGRFRWRPPPILTLVDGSHQRLRRLDYKGPGAVHVVGAHECNARRGRRGSEVVEVRSPTSPRTEASPRVIVLARGVRLRVR